MNTLITNYIKAKANGIARDIDSIAVFVPKRINNDAFTSYGFNLVYDHANILFVIEMNAEPIFVRIRMNESVHLVDIATTSNSVYEQALLNSLTACFEAMKLRAGY